MESNSLAANQSQERTPQTALSLAQNPEIISAYSRAQALDDEVLVDITSLAREAGIRYPVAVTAAVHAQFIHWDNTREGVHQDVAGRSWDLVYLLALRLRRTKAENDNSDTITFSIHCVAPGTTDSRKFDLKVVVGPGDELEPVLTVMLPWED